MQNPILSNTLGLIGAVIGGFLGYALFFWIVGQGYYGLMIPGALLGLGCSLLSTRRSIVRGVVCGLAGVGLELYIEWRFRPFADDKSLGYLLKHIPQLQPVTLLMIGLGGVFAFWLGKDASPFFKRPGAVAEIAPPAAKQH